MSQSEPLEIVPAISSRLHAALDTVQTILTQWWPELRRVPVVATPSDATASDARGTSASFVSGGVDSLYTCLKHASERGSALAPRLTHLVHIEGVEKPVDESVDAGLASIGLSLAAGFRRILIQSTHSYRHLFAWGSHPLLDPL